MTETKLKAYHWIIRIFINFRILTKEEEIRKLVKEAIEKTGASEMKDMGKVMQELMSQVKGKADGNLVGQIVKEFLAPKND